MEKKLDPPPPYPFHEAKAVPILDFPDPVVPGPPPQDECPPPRECWFTFMKYYIVVKSFLLMMACIMLAVTVVYVSLDLAFNLSFVFIFLGLLAAVPSVFAYYFWKIPIQGSLMESYTRLVIHAVMVMLLLLGSWSGNCASFINSQMRRIPVDNRHLERSDLFYGNFSTPGTTHAHDHRVHDFLPGSFAKQLFSSLAEVTELLCVTILVLKLHREKALRIYGSPMLNTV